MISFFLLSLAVLGPVTELQEPSPGVPAAVRAQATLLDSATAEMARGRYWHAARLLRSAGDDAVMDPGGRRLRLRVAAEMGWGNWEGVVELLRDSVLEETMEGGELWFALGRSLEGLERWEEAGEAFSRVSGAMGSDGPVRGSWNVVEARVRRGRSWSRSGRVADAVSGVREVVRLDETVGTWLALEVAREAADRGEKEATRALLEMVPRDVVLGMGWDLPARALLAGGDTAGAEAAYWSAIPTLPSAVLRARAWDRVAALRLALGDSQGARAAHHRVLELPAPATAILRASEALLAMGFDSVETALTGARRLASVGRHREALAAFRAHEELLGGPVPVEVRLSRARSHLALGEGRAAFELISTLLAEGEEPGDVATLGLRIRALRVLGRTGDARKAEDLLVEMFPGSTAALEILFRRADARRGRGDREGALRGFREVIARVPAANLAGEARMRMAEIHRSSGRPEEAIAVYRAYLEDFPRGRRWEEVAFWAGHTLLELDRVKEAREILEELRGRSVLSYHAVVAGFLLEVPFDPPVELRGDTLPFPRELREGLARLDRLRAAELEEGVEWDVERLEATARSLADGADGQDLLLRLAHELNHRGLTREGINLGWDVRREGRVLDRHLLEAIYPFPYREMIVAESRERGVDPFFMAGLIRQESAFWRRARSRADARGLMQVLPSTGRALARREGPRSFDADEHLYRPEINVHLGTAFFVDMRRRFGEDPTLILSAYNAGPTRANRWRRYPEAGDLPRFVERIPFSETRGYVRNVLLNREIYAWLYGGPDPQGPVGEEKEDEDRSSSLR